MTNQIPPPPSSQTGGWYPDPTNPTSEIYWNGSAWTEMRRKVAPSQGVPLAGAPFEFGPSLASAKSGLVATWQNAGVGKRLAMAAFGGAVLIGVMVGVAQCSSDFQTRRQCTDFVDKTYGTNDGSFRDNMIEHCIFMHKEFGVPIR